LVTLRRKGMHRECRRHRLRSSGKSGDTRLGAR
jgi:hypothetical protein